MCVQLCSSEVTRDEIVACAHIADVLLNNGHRELALSIVDAIHTTISIDRMRVVERRTGKIVPFVVASSKIIE